LVVWDQNPAAVEIIQGTQFATCFDVGPFTNQLFVVVWLYRDVNFLTDWPNITLDGGGFYPQNYNYGDPVSFDLLSRQIVTSGGAAQSFYNWTDGTNTCSCTFAKPSAAFGSWQFACVGWDFEAGECLSWTNLTQNTPISITGTLPQRNFNFNGQPCTCTVGGHPLSVASMDDVNIGMMAVLTQRPTLQIITDIYNNTKSKFGL